MLQFESVPCELLNQKVIEYTSKKKMYSNYFMNSLDGMVYAEGKSTLILKSCFDSFSRIYFLSDDKEELVFMLSNLTKNDAINIPSKTQLNEDLHGLLEKSGYELTDLYIRMIKLKNEDCGPFDGTFAKKEDADGIYKLLYDNFNPITDRLKTNHQISEMIEKNEILVNYNLEGDVNGLIMWTIDGKICNFHAWISKAPMTESLQLFFNAFSYLEERGIQRSTLWVNENNLPAKKIYEMLDYKYDGLKDYTFIKR